VLFSGMRNFQPQWTTWNLPVSWTPSILSLWLFWLLYSLHLLFWLPLFFPSLRSVFWSWRQ
jgi:hypothetical protein